VELNSGLLLGHNSSEKKEDESFALQQLYCVERKMHRSTALLKNKTVISYTLIAANIR